VTNFLASRNLAFRGSKEKFNEKGNGNFLGILELIGKFDPIMEDHINKSINKIDSVNHVGKRTQNELIHLMAENVRKNITDSCGQNKYFSIIADCTRDVSRTEQLTITIRFVEYTNTTVQIREHFIGFLEAEQTTGEYLSKSILKHIENSNLDIQNCRGQGYDNGANMKGCNIGVQKLILDCNPRAFFIPCACHNINLTLCDSANCCVQAISLFGFIQTLYNFFSASTKRWNI